MTNLAATTSPRKLLALCGVSGSGKTTLEKNLIDEYPQYFQKLQQVSTRKMREGERNGDPYTFVSREFYLSIKDSLVGRLGLADGSLFKDYYGSIPDFSNDKISTIILAEEGLQDLKDSIASGRIANAQLLVFGLDVKFEDLDDKDLREGRDEAFVKRERSVLKHADITNRSSGGRYLNPRTVVSFLKDHGMITS
jgi:guanylate kinase